MKNFILRAFIYSSPLAMWSVHYAYAATSGPAGTTATVAESPVVTAMDQAQGSAQDIETTRLIRKRLVSDNTLSTQAKNINIVTLGEIISLGGTVKNDRELSVIRQHVSDVSLSASIDDRQVKVAKAK